MSKSSTISTAGRQHHPHVVRWTRCRRPTPGTPARRWRWPRWPTRCGSTTCASTRSCRCGPTATGSCSPPGTPRRCCTRCCTWPGSSRSTRTTRSSASPPVSLDDLKRFRPARLQVPRAPRVPLDLRGRECTTGPLGTGIATSVGMAIAGLWQAATFNRPGYDAVRLRRLRAVRRRLPDGGHRRRGRLAGRAPEAVQPVLDLRQQQDHHRGQHRAWRSPRTCRPGSPATAGRCSTSPTPTTSTPWARRSRRSRPRPSGRR